MEEERTVTSSEESEEEGEDFDRIYDSHVERREADLEDSNVSNKGVIETTDVKNVEAFSDTYSIREELELILAIIFLKPNKMKESPTCY